MDSSRLSLVRAARLGPWPDNQLVALGGAGAQRCGRFVGFASQQGRNQQLRPTGRGLQQSDLAALGSSGGQAIRRAPRCATCRYKARYRLHDYDDVKGALERNEKENWLVGGDVWSR